MVRTPGAEATITPRRRNAGALDLAGRGDLLPLAERAVHGVLGLAADELAVALPRLDLVLDDGDLAAGQRVARQARDLDALEDIVVDGRLLRLGA